MLALIDPSVRPDHRYYPTSLAHVDPDERRATYNDVGTFGLTQVADVGDLWKLSPRCANCLDPLRLIPKKYWEGLTTIHLGNVRGLDQPLVICYGCSHRIRHHYHPYPLFESATSSTYMFEITVKFEQK